MTTMASAGPIRREHSPGGGVSHEATNTLYRLMCLAPYCPVGMVITIAVKYVTFYFFINNRVANNLIKG
jgi:hypothetical protein